MSSTVVLIIISFIVNMCLYLLGRMHGWVKGFEECSKETLKAMEDWYQARKMDDWIKERKEKENDDTPKPAS